MDSVPLLPLDLPPGSSLTGSGRIGGRGRFSFLRRLALGFGILAILGLLYVPAYHSAQGPLQGLAQLPGWSYNKSRDVRLYVKPDIITTIISPTEICNNSSEPLLIIIVCSSLKNFKAREAIRNTWAKKTELHNVNNSTVQLAFLVGDSGNQTLNENLKNESLIYKDIIQENFYDSYNNLTIKSIIMLKWVINNCNNWKFLMKTDDDMFVNLPILVKLLKTKSNNEGVLIGSLICNAKPITDPKNKWYMPKYMYSGSVYPNYLSGTGYVMSKDVVEKLYNTALVTPLIYLEDAYLTGICAKIAKLHPTNNPGFSFVTRRLDPCLFRTVITAHQVSPKNLITMWAKLNNKNLSCPINSASIKKKDKNNLTRKGRNVGYYSVRRRNFSKCV